MDEFCDISTYQSENMTWNTMKYREISEIFARLPIWKYDLKDNEISWNQQNFARFTILNFNQVFVDRIPLDLTIIKKIIQ